MKVLINLLAIALLFTGTQVNARTSDGLTGIWRADLGFSKEPGGPLIVRRSATGFSASIGGERAMSSPRGTDIRFTFGQKGSFRGTTHGRSMEGFWIRPKSDMQSLRDPGGSGSSYATPIRFEQLSPGVWRANVRPLSSRFT